jgi:hypothetical protein
MELRFTIAAFASVLVLGCAASGSEDGARPGLEDANALLPDGNASGNGNADADVNVNEDAGDSGGHTGAGTFDSGPPATVGGGLDSGSEADGAQEGGGCTTLAQCPYQSATNVAGVACTAGACVLTCNGETYDVNGVLADGCEVAGACVKSQGTAVCPIDDHTQALAANAGSFPCDDGSSAQNMTGAVPSDDRAHAPAIDGFDPTTGAAPDYFSIGATGGLGCQDDANLTLTVTGSKYPDCYVLSLLTDKNNGQTCMTAGNGVCEITNSSGSYSDGSTIYVWVSKNPTCAAATTPDEGTFQITGHL